MPEEQEPPIEGEIVFDKEGKEIGKLPDTFENIGKIYAGKEDADKAAEEATKEHDKKVEDLDTKVKELNLELAKSNNKVGNWKELRAKAEAGDIKLTETEQLLIDTQEKLEEVTVNKDSLVINDWKDKAVNLLVKSDPALQKKVLDQYDNIRTNAENEREVAAKMAQAYTLATGEVPKADAVLNVAGVVNAGAPPAPEKKDKMSTELKDLAKEIDPSLTDEDFEPESDKKGE